MYLYICVRIHATFDPSFAGRVASAASTRLHSQRHDVATVERRAGNHDGAYSWHILQTQ